MGKNTRDFLSKGARLPLRKRLRLRLTIPTPCPLPRLYFFERGSRAGAGGGDYSIHLISKGAVAPFGTPMGSEMSEKILSFIYSELLRETPPVAERRHISQSDDGRGICSSDFLSRRGRDGGDTRKRGLGRPLLGWVVLGQPFSSTRRILPEMVLGRSSRNSTMRGYL